MIRILGLITLLLLSPIIALAQTLPTPTFQAPWGQVGARVTLAATSTSGRVELGWVGTGQRSAPLSVWVYNPSTTVSVYVVPGDSTVVATSDGILVAPGKDITVALGGGTNIAAITDGGSVTLSIASGNGTPLARGGGTGGSSSGMATDGSNATSAALAAIMSAASYTIASPLQSTVTTGTAPFIVASTTNVANLNASLLGGATFAAPGAIGGTTPAAGTFTTLVASSTVSGASYTATGTGGAGFLDLNTNTIPSTPAANHVRLYTGGFGLSTEMATGFAGSLYMGGISASRIWTMPDVAGTLISTGDTGTVTNTMLAGSIDLSTKMTGTLANASVGPTPWVSGTGATLVAPREYYECTTTCTITLPTPASGYEFCVRNANNVATVITFAGIASVQFEVQAQTSYKTANTSIVAGGAVTDKACWVGNGTTKYDIGSMVGTWS